MTTKNRKFISNLILFGVILILASFFRIINLDLIEFKSDEAANLLISSRQLFDKPIPPGGTGSSVGVLNPPFFNYLLIPLTYITLDPKVITFFIAFINVLAIAFFFMIVKKYYNLTTATIASIFMSLSPWAILFSRKIWMQDLLIPFFVPLFLSLHKLIAENRQAYWVPYVAASLFLIQLHQASIFFLAPLTLFLLIKKTKINLKYILTGVLIGIIPLLPYLLYELSNGCPDCSAILMSSSKLRTSPSFEIFQRPLQILGQGNFDFILGQNGLISFSKDYKLAFELRKVLYIFYILIPLSIVIFAKIYRKFSFLIYSLIAVCFLYYFLKIEPQMHYFILFIPILSLSLGTFFDWIIKKGNTSLKALSVSTLLIIYSTLIVYNFSFFEFVKKNKGTPGDYGTSYIETKRNTDDRLKEYKERKDYEEIFLASHLPLRYMFGFMPLSKMVYPQRLHEEEIKSLEQRLENQETDPRINQKLIAYYTKNEPSIETVKLLRKKTESIREYKKVYDEVLSYYVSKNFLKYYRSERFDVEFFYPEHWKIQNSENAVILDEDNFSLALKRGTRGIEISCYKGNCNNNIDELRNAVRLF